MENDPGTETGMKTLLECKLAAMFPDAFTRRRVHRILQNYGNQRHEREPDRVRLAILKLAGADLQSVEKYTGYACADYRDVIAWAEYPRQARQWEMPAGDAKQKMIEADLAEYEDWLHGN